MISPETTRERPTVGKWIDGYAIPVINERAVRLSAGMLFSLGALAMGTSWVQGSMRPLQMFGMYFVIDMLLRVTAGEALSPSLLISQALVRGRDPQWVGASQKEFAWWMGLGLALTSCMTMSFLGAPLWVTLSLCSTCLIFLFLEATFGYCVGCQLQARFSKTPPQYCAGGVCPTQTQK